MKSFLDQARDLLTSAYTRGSNFIAKNPTPIGYANKQFQQRVAQPIAQRAVNTPVVPFLPQVTPKSYVQGQVINPIRQGVQQALNPKASAFNRGIGAGQAVGGVFSATPGGALFNIGQGVLSGVGQALRQRQNPQLTIGKSINEPTSFATTGLGIQNPAISLGVDLLSPSAAGKVGSALKVKGMVAKEQEIMNTARTLSEKIKTLRASGASEASLSKYQKNLNDLLKKAQQMRSTGLTMGIKGKDVTKGRLSDVGGVGDLADVKARLMNVQVLTDADKQIVQNAKTAEDLAPVLKKLDGGSLAKFFNSGQGQARNVAQPPVSDVPQGAMGTVGNKPLPEAPKPPTTPPIKGKPYIEEIQRLQDTKKVFDAGEMEPNEAKLFAKQWNDAVNIGALKENKVFAPPPGQSNPPTDPIQKLISALTEAKPLRGKQEALYREARAKQAGALSGIQGQAGGEQGFYKELGQLKGPLPKVEYENIRKNFTQTELDTLFNKVKENDILTPFEKVNAQGALMKMLGAEGGAVPTKSELALLSEIFPPELTKALLEKRPLIQKLMQEASDVLSLPRAFMATADFSAPFRQGVFLGPTHPKEFGSAFKSMFKYAFNPKAYEGFQESLKTRPNAKLYREFGLALSDTGSELSKREESFMSTIPEKIPLFKSIYKSSNRAYSGFLNKLRVDVFDNMVDSVRKNGQDSPEVIKDIAKFVNSATGRGDLGALSKHAEILNATMFAPRLVASRVNLLNPLYYAGLNPTVRKEALKSLVGFVGTGATVLGLAKLGGAEVGTDPRSADFGKIKIGNTRLDIWGGFQQYIKLVAQLTSGQLVNSETGKVMTLGEGYNAATRKDIIIRFLESKESPIIGLVTALVTGQNNMGKPLNVPSEVISRFIPLIAQDIYDLYIDKGAKGVALAVPGMFGVGSQTYGKKELAQGTDQLGRPTSQIRPVQDLPTVISNKVFGEQPLGSSGTTDASIYYKQLQAMPREQAAQQFDTITKSNPELAKKLVKIIKDEQKGLTVQDQVVKAKGVASGDRAITIAKEFKKLKTNEEKAKLWEHYVKTGVITKEVASQLATLLKEAK